MASLNFYLDTRRPKPDGTSLLKLSVAHQHSVRYVSLGIYLCPDVWDSSTNRVKAKHPHHQRLNAIIARKRVNAESVMLDMVALGQPFDVETLRDAITGTLYPERVMPKEDVVDTSLLVPMFERFAAMKIESTRLTYMRTLTHIKSFVAGFSQLRFEDVTRSWLMEFDSYMAKSSPSPNARAIHMRNLRAVFNFAIDEGVTSWYPFRKFKIKTVKTAHRCMSAEDLRLLFTMDVEEWQRPYRDFFMLSFLLIGTNAKDIMHLPAGADAGGRVVFNRAKTKKLYSIRVEREAEEIIERYRGKDYMINVLDSRTDYTQYIRQCNHALKLIGTHSVKGLKPTGEALWPFITTYYARHSWATIAAELDVPKETIAAALGHDMGNSTTAIYINFNQRKVDEANRRVIDYVLYGSR